MLPETQYIFVGSSLALMVLGLLFYIEDTRGVRFMAGLRRRADALVDWCVVRWHIVLLRIGDGTGRIGIHFLLHHLLRIGRILSHWLDEQLRILQRRNRRIARTLHAARTESHLTAIATHKHQTALSQEEKQKLKEQSLEG